MVQVGYSAHERCQNAKYGPGAFTSGHGRDPVAIVLPLWTECVMPAETVASGGKLTSGGPVWRLPIPRNELDNQNIISVSAKGESDLANARAECCRR